MLKELKDFFTYIDSKSPVNLRSFWISFITVALVVVLSKLGFKPPEIFNIPKTVNLEIVNPLPARVDVMESIAPKLEQKNNIFSIKRTANIVSSAHANGDYNDATAYGVIDYDTGEILSEKEFNTKTHIASLTKVMTAIVALDLASKDEEFSVSKKASDMIPTKIGVEVGEKLKLEELINALMLTSANDAAEIIREGIDQKYGQEIFKNDSSQSLFIDAMNEKARILNLQDSRFDNPQGFDSIRNFSSVSDLAVLAHYAMENYPLVSDIAKKEYQFYPATETHGQMDLYNWNGLVGVYPGAFGLKIGNTGWAKYTTIVSAERDGKKVLVVLLGAPGVLERDLWAAQLLDLGFEKLGVSAANITEEQLNQKYSSWKYWN